MKQTLKGIRDAVDRAIEKIKELLAPPPGSLAPVRVRPTRQPGH